jgi:hypothetical protein
MEKRKVEDVFNDYSGTTEIFFNDLEFQCGTTEQTAQGEEGTLAGIILKLVDRIRADLDVIRREGALLSVKPIESGIERMGFGKAVIN